MQEKGNHQAKYGMDTAIWIAAAVLTWKNYKTEKIATRDDLYFKQAEIIKLAVKYAKETDRRRGCFLCCADSKDSVNNYLRGDNQKNPYVCRLTMMEEFKERTYPEDLNFADRVEIDGEEITLGELFDFVKDKYPTIYTHICTDFTVEQEESSLFDGENIEYAGEDFSEEKNFILYGPPGTGKTYNSAIYAVAICDGKPRGERGDYSAVMKRYHELKEEGRIAFTTFHPSYSYEEFIEGIKPVMGQNKNQMEYRVEPGIFKKFCERAKTGMRGMVPYVFIIDEINRGDLSKIFGELITLIETAKRAGKKEAVSAILPYSGTEFFVPGNVYLIGTMNTADRSIALMDTALRRRFQFVEMMPDVQVLKKLGADRVGDLDVAAILEKINERLTFLYDREHTIGHGFFTGLRGERATLSRLQSIFELSILPLLQEYFYDDYQKIQLVLGDNAKSSPDFQFIRDDFVTAGIFKGDVDEILDFSEKVYSINKAAFGRVESYREIL